MSNIHQNKIQNEIQQIKKDISLLQDRLKKNTKKSESIIKMGQCKSKEYESKKDKDRIFLKPTKYKIY